MRYLMLLSVLVIIGFLMYLFANSRFSILSPSNPASNIEGINKNLDKMKNNINRYNSSVENVQEKTDDVLK